MTMMTKLLPGTIVFLVTLLALLPSAFAAERLGSIAVHLSTGTTVSGEVFAEKFFYPDGPEGVRMVENPYVLIRGQRYDFAADLKVQENLCKIGKLGQFEDASSEEVLNYYEPAIVLRAGAYYLDLNSKFNLRLNETICGGTQFPGDDHSGCSEGCGGDNAHGGDT